MTYYEILNIKQNATAKEIKNAYRILAKKYHPDTYSGNKKIAEEKMKKINEAYDVLSDEVKKEKYDLQFKVKDEVKRETVYHKQYTTYDNNYKSPDPRDAEYQTYYNYSPYQGDESYVHEPDYDFSRIKRIFEVSMGKSIAFVVWIMVAIGVLIFLLAILKLKVDDILEIGVGSPQTTQKEIVPNGEYNVIGNPNDFNIEIQQGMLKPEELENNIEEMEKQFNEWYETEGKEYEEQLKKELELLFKGLKNEMANN